MFARIAASPIFRYELARLRVAPSPFESSWYYRTPLLRRLWRWLLWLVCAGSLLFPLLTNFPALFPSKYAAVEPWMWLAAGLYFIVVSFHIALFILRAIALGIDLLAREHQRAHFDMLVLTGVSARTLIYGKWWAAMRSLRTEILMMTTIRVGLPLIIGCVFLTFWPPDYGLQVRSFDSVILFGLVFISTYIASGLFIAIGLMIVALTSEPNRAGAVAGIFSIALWVGLIFAGHGLMMGWVYQNNNLGGATYVMSTVLTIIEGGSLVSSWLMIPGWINAPFLAIQAPYFLLGLATGLGFYALLTRGLLFSAERLLVRRGMGKQ